MINKQNLKHVILFGFYFISISIYAQDKQENTDFKFDINADFVSRYIWRGQKLTETPAIQPGMAFSYKNITLGTWASYSFGNESVQEVDMYLSYSAGVFTLTLNDYFFASNSLSNNEDYFDWSKGSTQHWLEAIVELSDFKNIPINILAGVFIAGADVDYELKAQYSAYIELSYEFKIKDTEAQVIVGATPYLGYYSEGFNFINLGLKATKSIQITEKFSIPLSSALIINPANKNVLFQAIISL